MLQHRSPWRPAAALFALLLAIPGCGGDSFPLSTVEGSITVDGEPVPEGTVSFTPLEGEAGKPISADIRNGRYRSEQVPRGRNLVHLNAYLPTGGTFEEFGIEYPEMKNMIPESYMMGIELSVNEAAMSHDFELTSGGPQ